MTKCAAYLTPHPDNVELALELGKARNISIEQIFPKDDFSAGNFDALIVDLDGWGSDMRANLVDQLTCGPLPCPVVVHSYDLDGQGEALQVRGVLLSRCLGPELFRLLARALAWAVRTAGQVAGNGKRLTHPAPDRCPQPQSRGAPALSFTGV